MKLRKHQAEMVELCKEIRAGKRVETCIASVTPGGGKSALPVILSAYLIPECADRILWVVPRNSLKYQGETEFTEHRWDTHHRLRATDGNQKDPTRGNAGYITTYQAIGQNPKSHHNEIKEHKYIVFLDEVHHVAYESNWEIALQPIVDHASLVVYATGTLSRGDGQPIAFLPYRSGFVDFDAVDAALTYTRSDALRDGAISPVHFRTLDGSAEWENEDGTRGETHSLREAGEYQAQALFTALRTEYAMGLLWTCWRDYEREAHRNPSAQMLVVAPTIKLARQYQNVLRSRLGDDVPIATSEDTAGARETIAAYRRGVYPVLVTVAMAYEGMSVPQISHIACLTHIRSVPWLEQCFARANRLAPGKEAGYVYGPADPRFLKAIETIENEQARAIREQDESWEGGDEPREESSGEGRQWINPIRSGLHEGDMPGEKDIPEAPSFTPSNGEKALREQIRHLRRLVLQNARHGNHMSKTRVWNAIVRRTVNKKIDEMNLEELQAVWEAVRSRFGERLRG